MKLKAQNTIEIISLVTVVLVIVVAVFTFVRGNNVNIANLSKIDNVVNQEVGNLGSNINEIQINKTVDAETAGSLSSILANKNQSEITKSLKSKSISEILSVKTDDNKDVFDLANILINDLSLNIEQFDKSNLPLTVKDSLVQVAIEAKKELGTNISNTYTMYTAVLAKIIY